jgi:hypothetical protein
MQAKDTAQTEHTEKNGGHAADPAAPYVSRFGIAEYFLKEGV